MPLPQWQRMHAAEQPSSGAAWLVSVGRHCSGSNNSNAPLKLAARRLTSRTRARRCTKTVIHPEYGISLAAALTRGDERPSRRDG